VRWCGEDRAHVILQNFQPVRDMERRILAQLREELLGCVFSPEHGERP